MRSHRSVLRLACPVWVNRTVNKANPVSAQDGKDLPTVDFDKRSAGPGGLIRRFARPNRNY